MEKKRAIINWMGITRENVIEAIEIFLDENPQHPSPKNTFLIYEDNKLPAKHIRGMAYNIAYGQEISKSDFGGGIETVRFFERLGFEMIYNGKSENSRIKSHIKQKQPKENLKKKVKQAKISPVTSPNSTKVDKIKISQKAVLDQKNALQLLLNKLFHGDIVCEKTFPWLKTPSTIKGEYENLFKAVSEYRGDITFAKKNVKLRCDFVCESEKLIIEYDERQHFSEARKISLLSYPDIPLYFDKQLWIQACSDINAKDNNPINRDEIRAYYDSVRDIEAPKHGYKLVRIMHGQMDYEADGAEESLKRILATGAETNMVNTIDKKRGLKVGLYLQTDELKNKKDFNKALEIVKKSDLDIFVLPEFCYVPFISLINNSDLYIQEDNNKIYDACLDLSEELGKALIVSSVDKYGRIFSLFANADANDTETQLNIYIKHTMTQSSAFDIENYKQHIEWLFDPIVYKGYRIGMTICYDCNHSLFSRVYGLKDVDVVINSTGGDIVHDKWYKYNKVRAIENACYNFVTMGGTDKVSNPHAYVYGFNRLGKELKPYNLIKGNTGLNSPGGIYVYDILRDDGKAEGDISFNQRKTSNKNYHIEIPVGGVESFLSKSKKVAENIYIYKKQDVNIVFCLVEGKNIIKPEKVLTLLYAEELKRIKNKRYIIINKHKYIEEKLYKDKLSVIFKVRTMENFCALIVEADNINNCYQSGKNRTSQVIEPERGIYRIDLDRTSGPEAIWKNKASGMRASWRENFEWLIHEIENGIKD